MHTKIGWNIEISKKCGTFVRENTGKNNNLINF